MAQLNYSHFTLGIEEEYMVIDPESRELKSHEQKIVIEGQKVIKDKVKAEMHQAVVEVGTDICKNIDVAFSCTCRYGYPGNGYAHCQFNQVFSTARFCIKCKFPFLGRQAYRL